MLTTACFELSRNLSSLTKWTAFDYSHTVRVPHESFHFTLVDGIGRQTDIGENVRQTCLVSFEILPVLCSVEVL